MILLDLFLWWLVWKMMTCSLGPFPGGLPTPMDLLDWLHPADESGRLARLRRFGELEDGGFKLGTSDKVKRI